jgi:hypothetical protein
MTTTPFDLEALLRLWTDPLPEDDSAEDAFRAMYADPVTVNGATLLVATVPRLRERDHHLTPLA